MSLSNIGIENIGPQKMGLENLSQENIGQENMLLSTILLYSFTDTVEHFFFFMGFHSSTEIMTSGFDSGQVRLTGI